MSATWTVILNPCSASGKSAKLWPRIAAGLDAAGLDWTSHTTERPGHASELAQQAIEAGARQLLAVGGDGTAHEVANGILSQSKVESRSVTLAQIPIGTGNDWGRTMGIPKKLDAALKALTQGTDRYQDVGRVDFEAEGGARSRFFINVAGMGYDGRVTQVANERKARGKGGMMGYVGALVGCLLKYGGEEMMLEMGEERIREKVFSLAVGIGRYNGGGMKICPEAIPDDGLLDLTLIGDLPKWMVLRNVPRLFTGKFVHNKAVSLHRRDTIRVETQADNPIEVDGESIGAGSCTFTCLPERLRVRVGPK